MGKFDSSKTRVMPVFGQLEEVRKRDADVLGKLIALLEYPGADADALAGLDLTVQSWAWEGNPNERSIEPPVAMLEWLICHLSIPKRKKLDPANETDSRRLKLSQRDAGTMSEARDLLRTKGSGKYWFVLEGKTRPDVFIETPDAIFVIEGKRTELRPTTHTDWMEGRHQMLRHIDCAWEIKGSKKVFGFFIVDGVLGRGPVNPTADAVPDIWRRAAEVTASHEAAQSSLPHRSLAEQSAISKAFIGITTWQRICRELGLDFSANI